MDDRGPEASRRPVATAVVAAFVLVLALLWGFAALYELPVPYVHDEFAYLLTADTFAEGRLANPPHPFWEHFDTFHVLQSPTYQGKYPPAQGFFLALGQVVCGHPGAGVWLSLALASAATCWMLAAAVPRRWALVATLAFVLRYPVFHQWGQRYWGGAVAMLGGALLFGALLRWVRRPSARQAVVAGIGLFVLANARPFEGGLMALVAAVYALVVRRRERAAEERATPLAWAPLAAACVLIAAWTLYYDWRLTGDALCMPRFHWDPQASPHADIRAYRGSDEWSFLGKAWKLFAFYVGTTLAPFLILGLPRLRRPQVALAVAGPAVAGLACALFTRSWPHYMAPAAGLVVLLVAEGLHAVRGLRLGRLVLTVLLVAHFGLAGARHVELVLRGPPRDWAHDRRDIDALTYRVPDPGAPERSVSLGELGERHLVFVGYGPRRDIHIGWIWNRADVDAAAVVWARDLGPERNARLRRAMPGRLCWRLRNPSGERELVPLRR